MFEDFSEQQIDSVMHEAWRAFHEYRKVSLSARAEFMRCIAMEILQASDELITAAAAETHLGKERLLSELNRTAKQLNDYAAFCESGQWLDVRIDTGDAERAVPKPDIRKMLVPLGPIVVFGAANFPFAYSTSGGDTACAFAAGCPVIVKAHPGHVKTSTLQATAILNAVKKCNMPGGVFAHVYGAASAVGEALVKHPYTKGVGFTGSFAGGKQLFDWGNQRKEPIPVFAEMSSVNPVFLLPEKMRTDAPEIATKYAASISLSAGQFCTNPGVLIGIDNPDLDGFIQQLKSLISEVPAATMLNDGIYKNYEQKKIEALGQRYVSKLSEAAPAPPDKNAVYPTIAETTGANFIDNPLLQHEVFGPYSIIVRCRDMVEMESVAKHMTGQLTATLIGTEDDVRQHTALVEAVKNICGRLIMNGVPTGVETGLAMQHGGPFPATTDSRFTSVGADGIKRFARPMAFQNWADALLPPELQAANPLKIWRTVDNVLTK